ncbi:MAG: polysaccharide export protein [Gammaproteobacteria bacterium]|nr:polysaccharide export protein [Gammaproteobacteria bacterium]
MFNKVLVFLLVFSVFGGVHAKDAYVIGPGDVLSISVWKEEDMQKEVLVKPDGAISFPLIGDVNAKGMSTSDLKNDISNRLKEFIPNPVVTVSVLKSNSNKIYVIGKVIRPGEYITSNYMDVLQALSLAGGPNPFAETDEIKIIRRVGDDKEVYEFDYDEVMSGNRLEMNIILKAGDTVVVP